MDKAEQPTTQADRRLDELKPRDIDGHLSDAIQDCLRQRFGLVLSTSETTIMAQGAIAALNTRTTSLAAQDDWTTKRVAELVAEGYGHWRSCTGCHETNEGAETGDYPFNPVFKTYQGGGCGECGGIGVVWDDIDYADYAEFCLNADDDAPSLAAQDGLVAEIERQEGLVKTYRGAQLRAEEKLCREQANAQGWKRRAEILESKLAALSAIKEQHHD